MKSPMRADKHGLEEMAVMAGPAKLGRSISPRAWVSKLWESNNHLGKGNLKIKLWSSLFTVSVYSTAIHS